MNRILKSSLAVCLCLMWAATALADQGPPVKITLLGDPRGVADGETFKGTLEILTGADVELTDFRFESTNWRIITLDVASEMFMNKGGRLEIPFEVQALADAGQLVFKFDYEGYTVTETLNLTQKHFERMNGAGATRQVPTGSEPVRNPKLQSAEPMADKPVERNNGQPDPEDQENADKRTINVNGRFIYQRSDGVTMGADGVTVRIYDSDTFFDDHLATVVTDAQGYYSTNINTSDAGESNPDLYVNFESANGEVEVEDATWEINYTWETGVWNNFSGSTLNVGWLEPSSESEHPALHICTNITRTWRWLLEHEGYDTPATDVQWPDGSSGAWYVGFFEEIHISSGRQWNEGTHTHEYGHHWVENYADSVAPDYCNGVCDDDDCGHCAWCWETDHDAFAEGFPSWMADVVTRSYAGDYGRAPLSPRSQESLRTCGEDESWDNPLTTEGFLGALMRDIEDSGNDDHAHYPGFADVMSYGTNEIFDVVDFDQPTTPLGFLNAFKARYPSSREALWETGKNCGYQIDLTAPGAPTGMTSSHSTSGDSPDPTISFSWTTPYDDASGIQGYGIWLKGSTGMPSAVMDIDDVNSYTTESLAPGTYYFNLRALDRQGRWSATFGSYGPVTIRAAEPSDLTFRTITGWEYPLVPRNNATATGGAATVSPVLDGNTSTTHWNVRGINQGESATSVGFQTRLYVDDVYRYWWSWNPVGAGIGFFGINGGPFVVYGGRHTFEARFDATDQVSEVDELNNFWAHQFIWTPWQLSPNVPVTRVTPPKLTGGWSSVVGQSTYYNCDGLAPDPSGWWNAIAVRAVANDDDYDIRLHVATTGSENGFGANQGFSSRAAGCLDAVLYNKNVTSDDYNGGVLNWGDDVGNYVAEHVTSSSFAFGDSTDLAIPANDYIVLREFYVAPDDVGPVSITVDIDPADGPLYVQWLDEFFETGTLSSYNAQSITDPVTGRARLDFTVTESGFNCLVMYRDPKDGGAAMTAAVEIQLTPPDYRPEWTVAGWHSPLVPHPVFDGTSALVTLPDTLHGNVASTYLNLAVRNDSPTGSALLNRAFLDGVYKWWMTWSAFPGNGLSRYNWNAGWTVRGGRHTVDMRLDPLNTVEEIWEDNNIYGEQYVWSPLDLAAGSQVSRSTPPDRVGGWDEITSGETLWFNCDGLRIPTRTHWWQAAAVMPGAGTNVDMRLHPRLVGAKDGFGPNMAFSGWGPESSDFSVINYNFGASVGYDVGVLKLSGSGGYTADHAGADLLGTDPAGESAVYNIPAGAIVNLHEVQITTPGFAVHLIDDGGGVDWGISLMPSDVEFMSKSDALASAWDNAPGQREELNDVAILSPGYHCLVVWKAMTDDLSKSGNYHLVFGSGVSDVPDQTVPQVTALRNAYPNPFNPLTTIVFDLAKATRTEIAIYDLKGSLVRTLKSESLGVGRYEVVWNGTDNHGQRVASGVYMARMRAGDYQQMKKLMLVK